MVGTGSDFVRPGYRPDIDGLRAVAVLSVVGFHAFPVWVKGGFVGVDIFFVISAYLITTLLLINLRRGQFSYVHFYIRRINRLFPALLLILLASLVAGWFLLTAFEYKLFGKQIAAASVYVSNLLLWHEAGYFDIESELKPLLHLWSLAVEEQFYLVWPPILAFAWRRKWNLPVMLGAILLLSFAADLFELDRNAVATFFSPATRFWELAAGGLLATLEGRRIDPLPGVRGQEPALDRRRHHAGRGPRDDRRHHAIPRLGRAAAVRRRLPADRGRPDGVAQQAPPGAASAGRDRPDQLPALSLALAAAVVRAQLRHRDADAADAHDAGGPGLPARGADVSFHREADPLRCRYQRRTKGHRAVRPAAVGRRDGHRHLCPAGLSRPHDRQPEARPGGSRPGESERGRSGAAVRGP
ncbi:MAG TPA: acyltransferase [Reyranella sp.]